MSLLSFAKHQRCFKGRATSDSATGVNANDSKDTTTTPILNATLAHLGLN